MSRESRTSRLKSRRASAGGFTLIEMVTALGITAILLAAMVSAMMLAGKAVPAPTDGTSSTLTAGAAVDQIAGELETAILVLEQTPTSITFLVNPRNNDTHPERIRYSWAGTSGAPLLRQYNQGAASVVIPQVDQFSLTPTLVTNTESYPGAATEDSSDSLLIDYSGTSGLADLNVNTTNWCGQYFASATWPAGVIGWRPTRVMFQAKQSGLLGSSTVQLWLVGSNMSPSNTSYGQYTLLGTGLLSSYSWQQYSFSCDRLSPAAAVCLTVQGVIASPNSMTVETNKGAGLLQTNNAGSTFSYHSDKSIQSKLYGKLTYAGPTQYAVSRYLSALTIGLRAGASTSPMVTSTAQALNHPELLSSYWELKFDKDPTTVDVNADGTPDWAVQGGGSINVLNLVSLTWQSNGVTLLSQPGDNFQQLTAVDVSMNATSSGSWAQFAMNAARTGSVCAPIQVRVTQQSDGTQTLNAWRKLNDATTDAMLTAPGLPSGPLSIHLVVDPAHGTVAISINSVQYGTFPYNSFTSTDTNQSAVLSSSGSAQFNYVRIREFQR